MASRNQYQLPGSNIIPLAEKMADTRIEHLHIKEQVLLFIQLERIEFIFFQVLAQVQVPFAVLAVKVAKAQQDG